MSKILNTQLTGILIGLKNKSWIFKWQLNVSFKQLVEGHVYKGWYDDLKFYESFILQSHEKLASSFTT